MFDTVRFTLRTQPFWHFGNDNNPFFLERPAGPESSYFTHSCKNDISSRSSCHSGECARVEVCTVSGGIFCFLGVNSGPIRVLVYYMSLEGAQ
eukprot:jgi/Botrbrau1/17348/Bobra.0015s0093.1